MALSTCMRAFATLEVVLQVFLENLLSSLKNGGMISLDPLLTSKSLYLPLHYRQIEVSLQSHKFQL